MTDNLLNLDCSNNLLTTINLYQYTSKIQTLNCSSNNFSTILLEHYNHLTNINCSNNTLLTGLQIDSNNSLVTVTSSGNSNLTLLVCSYNSLLTSVNFDNNYKLNILACGFNPILSSMSIKNTTGVTMLSIPSINFNNINFISGLTSLNMLNCNNNPLGNIDISHNPSLTYLYCDYTNISGITLSGNNSLTTLSCNNNPISSFNLSHNPSLTSLTCIGCNIFSLDNITGSSLQSLSCGGASLSGSYIDLSNFPNLTYFYCAYTGIIGFNLGTAVGISQLYLNNNNLTSLCITGLTNPAIIEFSYNQVSSFIFDQNSVPYNSFDCAYNYLDQETVDNVIYSAISYDQAYYSLYYGGTNSSASTEASNILWAYLQTHPFWHVEPYPPHQYTLSVTDGYADSSLLYELEMTNIYANSPISGKIFDQWTGAVLGSYGNSHFSATTFTMGIVDESITATYADIYYHLSVNYGSPSSSYLKYTDNILVTADSPSTGMEFDAWTGAISGYFDNPNNSPATFYMGINDETVTATYKYTNYTLSVNNGYADTTSLHYGDTTNIHANSPDPGMYFYNWTTDGAGYFGSPGYADTYYQMGYANDTITANYANYNYNLSVYNGYMDESNPLIYGQIVHIHASGTFNFWSNTGPGSIGDSLNPDTTFTMGAGDDYVTAN